MRIDVGKASALEGLLPWDLVLVGPDGRDYATRRPTVADIAALESVQRAAGADVACEKLDKMFQQPGPNLSDWTSETLIAAVVSYMTYFNERSSKNSLSLAKTFREAVTAQMKPLEVSGS